MYAALQDVAEAAAEAAALLAAERVLHQQQLGLSMLVLLILMKR